MNIVRNPPASSRTVTMAHYRIRLSGNGDRRVVVCKQSCLESVNHPGE